MVMKNIKLQTRKCVLLHVHVLLSIPTQHESQIFVFTSIYISNHTNHLNTLVWMRETIHSYSTLSQQIISNLILFVVVYRNFLANAREPKKEIK